jgi:L-ascorbate metabolism protein UlaG (beta-lactamase superfamily)
MQLQRVNLDSSWRVQLGTTRLLLDPWLQGSEIDGFSWFSEQWHTGPCVPPERFIGGDAPTTSGKIPIDAIVITQPFDDHCHLETLGALPVSIPIFAVPSAIPRLRRGGVAAARLTPIPATGVQAGDSTLRYHPARWLDPTHGAVSVTANDGARLLVAPHGLLDWRDGAVEVLLVTHTRYALPWFVGGTVNLGVEAARTLAVTTRARYVVDTHSEPKRAAGWVSRLATPEYPSQPDGVLCFQDLEPRELP